MIKETIIIIKIHTKTKVIIIIAKKVIIKKEIEVKVEVFQKKNKIIINISRKNIINTIKSKSKFNKLQFNI